MTINAKCMEVIGVFVSYLLFVNYNVTFLVIKETGTREKYLIFE